MIIADTGFFIALFNANDDHHNRAIDLLNNLTENPGFVLGLNPGFIDKLGKTRRP